MNDKKIPSSVSTDRSKPQYEPPRVITFSADLGDSSTTQGMDGLIDYFEELVKLRLPYPTISYLALVTEYDFEAWFSSPAKFINKWRLAMLIAKGEADYGMIINVIRGGILYPIEEEYKERSQKWQLCKYLTFLQSQQMNCLKMLELNYQRCFCF